MMNLVIHTEIPLKYECVKFNLFRVYNHSVKSSETEISSSNVSEFIHALQKKRTLYFHYKSQAINAIYSENHKEETNTFCEQNVEFL
jgi:hypothetical protein